MKKKLLLFTSIGAVFLVGISAVAISGVNQLDRLQVKADPIEPTEYSVTFNESNTTVDDLYGHWVISTTTAGGNKVGVVGIDNTAEFVSFCNIKCASLFIFDNGYLGDVKAYDFDHITGFTVVFDGDLDLEWRDESEHYHEYLESGTRFNVTCAPYNNPVLNGFVTIDSLTVHYTC